MQFNLVVSTNTAAVSLWKKHGFQIIGTLPEVFRHKEHGLVDAYVMPGFWSFPNNPQMAFPRLLTSSPTKS